MHYLHCLLAPAPPPGTGGFVELLALGIVVKIVVDIDLATGLTSPLGSFVGDIFRVTATISQLIRLVVFFFPHFLLLLTNVVEV